MDFLSLGQIFMILGFISLSLEIFLLGLGTVVLLFLGISLVLVGLIAHYHDTTVFSSMFGASDWIILSIIAVVMTAVLSYIFWKPLKKYQGRQTFNKENTSDFIGHTFSLPQDINKNGSNGASGDTVTYRFSGIDWQVVPDCTTPMKQGTIVKVTRLSAGKMWVQPTK